MTSSYRPGAWFGVFGSATTLLLPASEKARVAALWSLVDDGAGFDAVLDALLQSGLGGLPGFVLASGDDGPVQLLVRGPVVVTGTADGAAVRIDGRDALTWVERTLDEATTLTFEVADTEPPAEGDGDGDLDVDLDGPDGDVDLPILGGLVRVARVDRPARTAATPAAAPVEPAVAGAAEESPDESPEGAPEETPPDEPEAEVAAAVPAAPPEPSPLDDEADADTDAVAEAPLDAGPLDAGPLDQPVDLPDAAWAAPTPAPPLPPPPPVPPSPPSWQDDPLTAPLPVDGPPEEPGEQPDAIAATDDDDADHDGLTRLGDKGEEFARELPGIPGQPAAPRVVPPVARLLISNGESVEVDRVVLIGRAPEARRFSSTEQPRLVTVPSPLHEISSTHVEVRPGSGADHGSAVVTDMGSTNGTVIEQPGLGHESLRPGIAVQLIPGATINLGDGVTIQVIRP
jgi:hypothetical protein